MKNARNLVLAPFIRNGLNIVKVEFRSEEDVVACQEGYKWLEEENESKDNDCINENKGSDGSSLSREDKTSSESGAAQWAAWPFKIVVVDRPVLRLFVEVGSVGDEPP